VTLQGQRGKGCQGGMTGYRIIRGGGEKGGEGWQRTGEGISNLIEP